MIISVIVKEPPKLLAQQEKQLVFKTAITGLFWLSSG